MFMNTITGEYYGKETTKREPSKEFEKRTGIRVSMTRASSGETLTKIRAEKSNPKGDVWWGGTGD